jgi:hypothetical protein
MSFVTHEVGHIRRNWYARNYAEGRGTPWNSFLETGIARDSLIRVWKRLLRVVCPLKDLWSNNKTALLTSDILALVKGIKIVSYKFEGHRHTASTLLNANRDLLVYEQGTQHLDDYYDKFKSRCEVIEQYGGTVAEFPIVTAACIKKGMTVLELTAGLDDSTITQSEYQAAKSTSVKIAKGALFLQRANKKYEPLMLELQNKYSQGTDDYPTTVEEAYNCLVTYVVSDSGNNRTRQAPPAGDNNKMAFVQHGLPANPAHNLHPTILCYNCQHMGHYSNECPLPDAREATQESVSTLMQQDHYPDSDFRQDQDPDLCFCNSNDLYEPTCKRRTYKQPSCDEKPKLPK